MNKNQLAFALCPISNQKKWELFEYYKDVDKIWDEALKNKDSKVFEKMSCYYENGKMDETKAYLDNLGINIVSINDKSYPRNLKNISNPPLVLFYKGDLNIIDSLKTIAIVGARECTSYGENFTKVLLNYLSKFDVNIISGGAGGIDSLAHKYALQYGLKTTAVFGCGIDIYYPKINEFMFKSIEKNGLILSEFIPGTPPFKYNFPIRNRIISALSTGVIAIEGRHNSGTTITARCAISMGKEVFALQGAYFDEMSRGCRELWNEGARPISELDDIEKAFGLTKKENIKNIKDKNKNKIYNIISDNPIYIDDLIRIADVDITTLYELLFELQLDKLILCLNGNYYVRNI